MFKDLWLYRFYGTTLFQPKGHKGHEGKTLKIKVLFPSLCTWCPSCLGFSR
jgi:hypothetical protein